VRDAISFSSLIEHEGELVGGSFKIERATTPKTPRKKSSSKPASSNKSAPVAQPQPPSIPAAYAWVREVAAKQEQVYNHTQFDLPVAPQPPLPTSYYQQPEVDYSYAPGGIAHEGNTDALPIVRRTRPILALMSLMVVILALLGIGISQLGGGKGGVMLSGLNGDTAVALAGQVAPGLLENQNQQAQAPQAPQAANGQAMRHPVPGDYRLLGAPSISVATIEKVLKQYNSPAVGNGQAFYDLGVKYGVDPAFMLAFYVHESAAGTAGAAVATRSVGNIICAGWSGNCIGRFRAYDNYAQAAEDWYQLVTGSLYIGAGLDTPEKITPRYAPDSDNNDSSGYAKSVERMVDEWRTWE
jgi:hypothetical protein